MATELLISGSLDTIVVVQNNLTKHLINWLQIKQFARTNNQDILIFWTEHYRLKKNNGNFV